MIQIELAPLLRSAGSVCVCVCLRACHHGGTCQPHRELGSRVRGPISITHGRVAAPHTPLPPASGVRTQAGQRRRRTQSVSEHSSGSSSKASKEALRGALLYCLASTWRVHVYCLAISWQRRWVMWQKVGNSDTPTHTHPGTHIALHWPTQAHRHTHCHSSRLAVAGLEVMTLICGVCRGC